MSVVTGGKVHVHMGGKVHVYSKPREGKFMSVVSHGREGSCL